MWWLLHICWQGAAANPDSEEQQQKLREAAEGLRMATNAAAQNAIKKRLVNKLEVRTKPHKAKPSKTWRCDDIFFVRSHSLLKTIACTEINSTSIANYNISLLPYFGKVILPKATVKKTDQVFTDCNMYSSEVQFQKWLVATCKSEELRY